MAYTSTIVFVGNDFHRAMIDERGVVEAPIDREKTVAAGPFGEFSYAHGYKLTVEPERILVAHSGETILSDVLLSAASTVVSVLQSRDRQAVTGVGMNLEANFVQGSDGVTGTAFCMETLVQDRLSELVGGPLALGCARVLFFRGGMQHDVRLEPHFQSSGANLYLSVNIHQTVAPEDDLNAKLTPADDVRTYLQDLCGRVSAQFQETM